jgi:phosphoribosylanthranilate isomerase
MPLTRIKICCMSSIDDAAFAIDAGAHALGFVSAMPSGAGIIDEELIARIVATVPVTVATFLLTSAVDADTIVAQQRRTRANTIQLVDRTTVDTRRALRASMPGIGIVQVVHVTGLESAAEAHEARVGSDAVLLDSGNPSLAVKELGGTGRVHDWDVSARICRELDVPVFLAGGLNPGNVADAVRTVRPFGVDVCSGLRPFGKLDAQRVTDFVRNVRTAFDGQRDFFSVS